MKTASKIRRYVCEQGISFDFMRQISSSLIEAKKLGFILEAHRVTIKKPALLKPKDLNQRDKVTKILQTTAVFGSTTFEISIQHY